MRNSKVKLKPIITRRRSYRRHRISAIFRRRLKRLFEGLEELIFLKSWPYIIIFLIDHLRVNNSISGLSLLVVDSKFEIAALTVLVNFLFKINVFTH